MWSIEMSIFYVFSQPRKSLKAQMFAKFIAEMTLRTSMSWIVFTNGSSNNRGSDTDLIIENEVGLAIYVSLCFEFSTANN